MVQRCPICGTEIKIVNNRWFCPNHGFLDEEETKDEESKYNSYFG